MVGRREAATLGLVGVLELAPTLMRCGGDSMSRSDGSADSYVWVSSSPLKGISAVTACGLLGGPEEGESMPRGMGPSCLRISLCHGLEARSPRCRFLHCSHPLPQFLICPPLRRRNSEVREALERLLSR